MDQKKKFDNKSEKETLRHKAGDKIERLGEKMSNAGLPKTGKAIYNAGNKLEHSDK
ncbi:MAG: hypothetical protein AB7K68_00025 [Bacteriovoracia bacterium]